MVELEPVAVVSFWVQRSIIAILEPVVVALNFVDVVGAFIPFLKLHGHVGGYYILPDQYKISNLQGLQDACVVIMCFPLPILCLLDKLLCLGMKASDSVKFSLCIFFRGLGILIAISILKGVTELIPMQEFGRGKPG